MSLFKKQSGEQQELQIYRDVMRHNTGRQLNQWYQLRNEAANLVGFEYVCLCGVSYTILNITSWMQITKCHCGNEIDLAKFLAIPRGTAMSDLGTYFAKLPIRQRLAGRRTPRALDTWAEAGSGEIGWDGAKPYGLHGMK